MAKKQYDSPQMKLCVLDCRDAITTSEGAKDSSAGVGNFQSNWKDFFGQQ